MQDNNKIMIFVLILIFVTNLVMAFYITKFSSDLDSIRTATHTTASHTDLIHSEIIKVEKSKL